MEYGCGMIEAGFPSFFGLGVEHSPIPPFWLLMKPFGLCCKVPRATVLPTFTLGFQAQLASVAGPSRTAPPGLGKPCSLGSVSQYQHMYFRLYISIYIYRYYRLIDVRCCIISYRSIYLSIDLSIYLSICTNMNTPAFFGSYLKS